MHRLNRCDIIWTSFHWFWQDIHRKFSPAAGFLNHRLVIISLASDIIEAGINGAFFLTHGNFDQLLQHLAILLVNLGLPIIPPPL
jgi:hypothetical protein